MSHIAPLSSSSQQKKQAHKQNYHFICTLVQREKNLVIVPTLLIDIIYAAPSQKFLTGTSNILENPCPCFHSYKQIPPDCFVLGLVEIGPVFLGEIFKS